jgi:hypothetical protein
MRFPRWSGSEITPSRFGSYKDAVCDGRLLSFYRKGVVRDGFFGGPLDIFTENPENKVPEWPQI